MDRLASMETFVRVIESGSFSGAARHLRIGQPAVSKIVSQLETRLCVKLLTRTTRGLTPTEAGEIFYKRAKRAIEAAADADMAARGAGSGLIGRLRVSTFVTFARIHLIPLLPQFMAEHPELNLELVLSDGSIDLIQEGIDLGLKIGPLSDSSQLARSIRKCPVLVIGTRSYLNRHGTPAKPDDLIDHQIIKYPPSGNAWSFQRGRKTTTVTLNGRLTVSSAEAVRAAVFADMGLAIASRWMFDPELRSGAVESVLSNWILPDLDLWAVFPASHIATAKARAFVSFVERALPSMKPERNDIG